VEEGRSEDVEGNGRDKLLWSEKEQEGEPCHKLWEETGPILLLFSVSHCSGREAEAEAKEEEEEEEEEDDEEGRGRDDCGAWMAHGVWLGGETEGALIALLVRVEHHGVLIGDRREDRHDLRLRGLIEGGMQCLVGHLEIDDELSGTVRQQGGDQRRM